MYESTFMFAVQNRNELVSLFVFILDAGNIIIWYSYLSTAYYSNYYGWELGTRCI